MINFYFVNMYHWGDVYLDSKRIEYFASQYNGNVYYITTNDKKIIQRLFSKVKVLNYPVDIINSNIKDEEFIENLMKYPKLETEKYIIYNTHIANFKLECNKELNYCDFINLDILSSIFTPLFDNYNIKMKKGHYYIPRIIEISEYKRFITILRRNIYPNKSNFIDKNIVINENTKKILLCNGPCHSGQIENVPFDFMIDDLLKRNYIIYVTHDIGIDDPNIIKISEFKPFPNIDFIAYFARFMDIIIGRDSGLFFWTQNRSTMNKLFICFTKGIYKIHDIFNVKPIANYDLQEVLSILDMQHIKKIHM